MSDASSDAGGDRGSDGRAERVPEGIAAADGVLAELREFRTRAAAAAEEAGQSRAKAGAEALHAFEAKEHTEQHFRVIAERRGTVEADASVVAAMKSTVQEAHEAVVGLRRRADEELSGVSKAREQAEEAARSLPNSLESVSATVRAVTESRQAVELASEAAKSAAQTAKLDADAATAHKNAAEQAAAGAKSEANSATESAERARAASTASAAAESESRASAGGAADVLKTAHEANERVKEYESKLTSLQGQFAELHAKVEGLLPGAASASLASAFRKQKERFDWPRRLWIAAFLVSMVAWFGIAFYNSEHLFGSPGEAQSWDVILRHLVPRVVLVGPFVWIAILAARQFRLAGQVQEDYAFKEATSTVFEGYKREVSSIAAAEDSKASPVHRLCDDTLRTLSMSPGRFYERKQQDDTPGDAIAESVANALKSMKGARETDRG